MKIIASIKKSDEARYISHLDIQRALQRTVRRADIPVSFSQGFNPHPQISFATALSVGVTGSDEWIEIRLERDMTEDEFMRRMNDNFPRGMSVTEAHTVPDSTPSVASMMVSAEYSARAHDTDADALQRAAQELFSGDSIIVKKSKKQNGRKVQDAEVDIRPMLYSLETVRADGGCIELRATGRLDASGGLNMDLLLGAISDRAGVHPAWRINRDRINLNKKLW